MAIYLDLFLLLCSILMGVCFYCRYPRVTAEEVEAEMEEMAAELEPLLPPPAGV